MRFPWHTFGLTRKKVAALSVCLLALPAVAQVYPTPARSWAAIGLFPMASTASEFSIAAQSTNPQFAPLVEPRPTPFLPLKPMSPAEQKRSWWILVLEYPVLFYVVLRLIGMAFESSTHRRGYAEKIHNQSGEAQPGAAVAAASKRHHSRLRWILAGGLAAILGMVVLLRAQAELGQPVLINALILSILPLPIWIVLTQWIHRFKTEPVRMLAAAFFWGATVACFFSLWANTSFARWAVDRYGTGTAPLGAVLSAPWVEESLKGLFVLFLFFWPNARFDDVIDGIVYATMVGLGFAMMENVVYLGRAIVSGHEEIVRQTVFGRLVMGPFVHPFFTCMFGIGLGFSRETDNRVVKIIAPVAGFFLAMFLHYTWNLTLLFDGLLKAAAATGIVLRAAPVYYYFYLLFMFPAFLAVITLIMFQLGREGVVISQNLLPEVQSGILGPVELKGLTTVTGRLKATTGALLKGGVQPWIAQRKFHQVASELAFHRYRVAHGISRQDDTLESAFVQRLRGVLAQSIPVKVQTQTS